MMKFLGGLRTAGTASFRHSDLRRASGTETPQSGNDISILSRNGFDGTTRKCQLFGNSNRNSGEPPIITCLSGECPSFRGRSSPCDGLRSFTVSKLQGMSRSKRASQQVSRHGAAGPINSKQTERYSNTWMPAAGSNAFGSWNGVMSYASKGYMGKAINEFPEDWINVGRWWGVIGRENLPKSRVKEFPEDASTGIRFGRTIRRYSGREASRTLQKTGIETSKASRLPHAHDLHAGFPSVVPSSHLRCRRAPNTTTTTERQSASASPNGGGSTRTAKSPSDFQAKRGRERSERKRCSPEPGISRGWRRSPLFVCSSEHREQSPSVRSAYTLDFRPVTDKLSPVKKFIAHYAVNTPKASPTLYNHLLVIE